MVAYLRADPDNLVQLVVAPRRRQRHGHRARATRAARIRTVRRSTTTAGAPDGTAVLVNYDADKKALPAARRRVSSERARPR